MGNAQWIGNSWRPDKWRTTKGNWERCSTRVIIHAALNLKNLSPYLIVEVIHELGEIYGDRAWGFKHPNFTQALPVLVKYFPDAWYIHCRRKAKHVAKSMKVVYPNSGKTEADYFKSTLKNQEICKEWLSKVNRILEIDIEDYKKYGEDGVLRMLSQFTGVPILSRARETPAPFTVPGPCGGLMYQNAMEHVRKLEAAGKQVTIKQDGIEISYEQLMGVSAKG